MEPGGNTHSLQFAGKSDIFILLVSLLLLSLFGVLSAVCLEGRDVLVPVQVDEREEIPVCPYLFLRFPPLGGKEPHHVPCVVLHGPVGDRGAAEQLCLGGELP